MKHATLESLEQIRPVLDALRRIDGLSEKKPGVFYRRSTPCVHFHEDSRGMYADLRDREIGWSRLRVCTAEEVEAFLAAVRGVALP